MTALEANIKLVHYVSRRILSRILHSGVNAEYDDIFQEASIVWLECEKRFDQDREVKFATYFYNAAQFTIFRQYQRKNSRLQSGFYSLDNENEDGLMMEVEDGSLNAEMLIMQEEMTGGVHKRLSPLAQKLFELLTNPPRVIIDNLEALQEKAEYARTQGIERRAYKDLNLQSLCRILGFDKDLRCKIAHEFKEILNESELCR